MLAVCLCFQLFCGTASAEVIHADDENPGQVSSFPDVPAIADMGIISGYGNGEFRPNNSVTYAQIIKMLVCAWGLENQAQQEGGYPNGYIAVAKLVGFTDGVTYTAADPAPRRAIAVLMFNSLFI